MNAKLIVSAVATALLLAACGNKGPLVMPQKPVPVEQPAPAAPASGTEAPAQPAEPLPAPPAGGDASDG